MILKTKIELSSQQTEDVFFRSLAHDNLLYPMTSAINIVDILKKAYLIYHCC